VNLTNPRTGGLLLMATAPTLLAAELVRSDHSQERYAAQLADVSAHRTPELLSAVLFVAGGILLVLAAIGLAGAVREGRGRTLVQLGAASLGIGGLWMAAGRAMFEVIVYALSAANTTASAASLDRIGNSAGTAIFVPLLLVLVAGPVLLTIGLGRAGLASRWLGAVWFAGLIVFLGTETSKLGNLVGFGAMMAVLAVVGFTIRASAVGRHASALRPLHSEI
jgi:hypothetical protein